MSDDWVLDPNPFYFQQFAIHHHRSAFKVNTDGVLLAAWAEVSGKQLLDIGTGSGVMALVAAQRNKVLHIEAIDIDLDSCRQATYNVDQSPFNTRVIVTHSDIAIYTSHQLFDHILCNPPFHIDSTQSTDGQLSNAKHSSFDFFHVLFKKVNSLLLPENGTCAIIVPVRHQNKILEIAKLNGLYPTRVCSVSSFPDKDPFNILIEFCSVEQLTQTTSLAIYTSQKQHSPEYIEYHSELYQKFSAQH